MTSIQVSFYSRVFLTAVLVCTAAQCEVGEFGDELAAPPERAEVYVIPFSHLDLFWGGTREECLNRGNRIIARALALARNYPDFRFLIEDNVFAADFVESHRGSPEVEELKRLVKAGRIEIAPKWASIYQNIPRGEAQIRNILYGKRFAREIFGVDPQVAHLGDLPGYTPQFVQILAKTRIPFMVMTRMGPPDKALFRWQAPDGSKALVWNTVRGYGWGVGLGLHANLDDARIARIQKEVEEVRGIARGPIYLGWGTDLWAPNEKLAANIAVLNQKLSPLGFKFGTPTEFFGAVLNDPGIPTIAGEIPSSWSNLISSNAALWPPVLPATDTLLSAEKFAAINYALGYSDYPQQQFDLLWNKLLQAMDHNNDGQGGDIGDERKVGYAHLAALEGGEILRDMLRNIANRVRIPVANSHPIVVFNPLGWNRDDVVKAHVTLFGDAGPAQIAAYRKGMRLVDENGRAMPFHVEQYSENISRAVELVFVARNVPSLGYRTYFLTPAETPDVFPATSQVKLDSENDLKEPRRAPGADVIENEFYRLSVDRPTGRITLFDKTLNRDVVKDMYIAGVEERGGNAVGNEPATGRMFVQAVNQVNVEENNPVRTVVRVLGEVAGIPVIQRLTLYGGLKRLDIENTVDWKVSRYLRLQQVFPLTHSNARIQYGIPFGSNSVDGLMPNAGPHFRDEISPESWRRIRQIQEWIFAGEADWGLTVSADTHMIQLQPGAIHGEMLRGIRYSSAKVVRGEKVTSMEFPPSGLYVFRYSLTSAAGDWKAARSYRSGMNLNNPLLPVSVADDVSQKSLPPAFSFCSVGGENLVVSALKKSETDGSLVLHVFEVQGGAAQTRIELLGKPQSFREVNLLDDELPGGEKQTLRTGPYEIKAVKLRVGR